VLRLLYNSLTTPGSIIDYHIPSGRRATRKVQAVLGGFSSGDYASERVWATSHDGARVPISLVYRKELFKKDGSNNLMLYGCVRGLMNAGPMTSASQLKVCLTSDETNRSQPAFASITTRYGSYGMSMDPSFDSKRLSLLDRGWVYAIAHSECC
jgi:oligopeptidase B